MKNFVVALRDVARPRIFATFQFRPLAPAFGRVNPAKGRG
jgi:hypothetical protein